MSYFSPSLCGKNPRGTHFIISAVCSWWPIKLQLSYFYSELCTMWLLLTLGGLHSAAPRASSVLHSPSLLISLRWVTYAPSIKCAPPPPASQTLTFRLLNLLWWTSSLFILGPWEVRFFLKCSSQATQVTLCDPNATFLVRFRQLFCQHYNPFPSLFLLSFHNLLSASHSASSHTIFIYAFMLNKFSVCLQHFKILSSLAWLGGEL